MTIFCAHPDGRVVGDNKGLTGGYWYECEICGGRWDRGQKPPKIALAFLGMYNKARRE